MKIKHKESNSLFEITEAHGNYMLVDAQEHKSYDFSQSHEAMWKSIVLVRELNLARLNLSVLDNILKRSNLSITNPESLLSKIKGEEINRTYYDKAFMKLLANYKMLAEQVMLSNKTNFPIEDEVSYIIRKKTGAALNLVTLSA